jgi:hypothetical protein
VQIGTNKNIMLGMLGNTAFAGFFFFMAVKVWEKIGKLFWVFVWVKFGAI